MIRLPPGMFAKLVDFLLPHVDDERRRHALIDPALSSYAVYYDIDWSGSPREFSVHLVSLLSRYSKETLILLLDEMRRLVGDDAQIKTLKDAIINLVEVSTITNGKAGKNIFLSYAYDDEVIADQVKRYLEESGFRVFCSDINVQISDSENMLTPKTLLEAEQMVLLLSESSMPYNEKVFQEWNFFYTKDKPILGLIIQTCSINNRLYAYHRIDARDNLLDALFQLNYYLLEPFSLITDIPAKNFLERYHQDRISELTHPHYQIDNRFVQLTLLLDQGEETQKGRWSPDARRYNDLRDVLQATVSDSPALVLLGAPGGGKSTLLRRLQLEQSMDYLQNSSDKVAFFISLNRYGKTRPVPRPYDWLVSDWHEKNPELPSLKELLKKGRVLLLLDALNEMPSRNYHEYLEWVDLWRGFLQDVAPVGNRIVFSCRTLDYSSVLSGPDLRVPQVEIEPMTPEQIYHFLQVYSPSNFDAVWAYLENSPQLKLYSRPYFLKLLVEQVKQMQDIPKGSAELFTGFVRRVLQREIEKGNPLFVPGALLSKRDRSKLALKKWASSYDLPQQGILIPSHSNFAFQIQSDNLKGEGGQIRVDYETADALLNHPKSSDILQAGLALGILEEDIAYGEIAFFHQLLQEYFAARHLTIKPNPNLVKTEWRVDQVMPSLAETIETLVGSDPLPPLPTTGWEETTLLAAAMNANADTFIQSLIDVNLPLAAQCASLPEVKISNTLGDKIRQSLLSRVEDKNADLRARISAGQALGKIGDPRFQKYRGPFGDYLLPPMINISGGVYTIGCDEGDGYYEDEAPVHNTKIEEFQIGKFPVTNAEYALFIESGSYQNESWWDTPTSKLWLHGEESKIQIKNRWRKNRFILQSDSITFDWLIERGHITARETDFLKKIVSISDDEFETFLNVLYASGKRQIQPRFWENRSFNNPSQPVVGLCWYEARAYCAWLTAQINHSDTNKFLANGVFRLPTEVEWEAAASGVERRRFAFGETFDFSLSNTLESHTRCSTPIGIYPGGETPEGVADLSGNIYEWTSTAYFSYPYNPSDGRENPEGGGAMRRVLRGGAFFDEGFRARCACRLDNLPHSSPNYMGFRLAFQRT